MKQEIMGWHWHRLDNVQNICTSLQADYQTSTSSLNFLQARCSSWHPANSVKALKALSVWQLVDKKFTCLVHQSLTGQAFAH